MGAGVELGEQAQVGDEQEGMMRLRGWLMIGEMDEAEVSLSMVVSWL